MSGKNEWTLGKSTSKREAKQERLEGVIESRIWRLTKKIYEGKDCFSSHLARAATVQTARPGVDAWQMGELIDIGYVISLSETHVVCRATMRPTDLSWCSTGCKRTSMISDRASEGGSSTELETSEVSCAHKMSNAFKERRSPG